MLKLFQGNMALQAVLILAATALLWMHALIASPLLECGDHPAILYGFLCRWLSDLPQLAVILAILLIVAEGVFLNILLTDTGLVGQNSLLPTLLYILAASAGTNTLTPIILVNGVAIFILRQLFLHGTLLTIPSGKICAATALIAIASLLYQPAVFLLLTYLLIAANYRLYSARDWALMILGFMAPYLLLLGILYLTDGIPAWWHTTVAALSTFHFSLPTFQTPLSTVASLLLAAIFLWGLLNLNLQLSQHPVLWQKNAATVMLFIVGALGMMLYAPLLPLNIPLFAIPFTLCTQHTIFNSQPYPSTFRKKKHPWIYDILFLLIIAAAYLC